MSRTEKETCSLGGRGYKINNWLLSNIHPCAGCRPAWQFETPGRRIDIKTELKKKISFCLRLRELAHVNHRSIADHF